MCSVGSVSTFSHNVEFARNVGLLFGSTTLRANAGSMLVQSRRPWAKIKPTLFQRLVFSLYTGHNQK